MPVCFVQKISQQTLTTRTYTHLRNTHNTHTSFAWGAIIPALPYHLPRCSRQGVAGCHPHTCSHLGCLVAVACDAIFEISNLLCALQNKEDTREYGNGGLSRIAGCDVRRFGCVRRALQRQSHDLYLFCRTRCNCTLSGLGLWSNVHLCGGPFCKQDNSVASHTLAHTCDHRACVPRRTHTRCLSLPPFWSGGPDYVAVVFSDFSTSTQ